MSNKKMVVYGSEFTPQECLTNPVEEKIESYSK